jgi:hypothetical protein
MPRLGPQAACPALECPVINLLGEHLKYLFFKKEKMPGLAM